jgi:tRNA A22 N-methylase
MKQQTEMAKMEQENLLNERDNETKILVAQISAQARQYDEANTTEGNEVMSEESRAKLNEQIREFDARLALDKERLAFDKDKAKTDARLKEKQINSRPKPTKK